MAKLLVADDDPHIVDALATYGRSRGYVVLSASRGDEALTLIERERPDAILLDVMMPGLDGRDVLRRMRQAGIGEQAVVLFVTARDSQSDRRLGLELGADEYETKPFNFSMLFDKIGHLLEKKRRGEI